MLPRPIHKWKTLWLGLLILVFLTWAWARSISHIDYASARLTPYTWCGIVSSEACLSCGISHYTSTGSSTNFDYASLTDSAKPWFPQPIQITHFDSHSSTRTFYSIAHWLITLLFLLTWSSLLLWRWKKSKRPTSPQTPPAPSLLPEN